MDRSLTEKKLTIAEVAVLLNVSKMTVRRLVDTGEITGYKIGTLTRIPERAVTSYLQEKMIIPRAERRKTAEGKNLPERY